MSAATAYCWIDTSKETLEAMRLRCESEGHDYERMELVSGQKIKRCRWCGAQK